MRRTQVFLALPTVAIAFAISAAGSPATSAATAQAATRQAGPAEATVFLLGDAGKPENPTDPVLVAMAADIRAARLASPSGEVAVAFLGDNVYENGVPEREAGGYEEYVRRLIAQVDVLGEHPLEGAAPVRGVFVPGNHDWAGDRDDGWDRIRRQEEVLSGAASDRGIDVALMPAGGCPGPELVDVGNSVRLIAIDTQWWLRTGPKPIGADSPCPAQSVEELLAKLDLQLASAGDRLVIVLAHHPVASGGPHGGHLALKEWFWPTYNLLYYPYRKLTKPLQDLDSEPYATMIAGLLEVYAGHPPLLMASGHDHNLQVIEGDLPRYQLVSGAGSKRRAVGETSDPRFSSLFWSELNGYMRLALFPDDRVHLTVTVVEKGSPKEAFSLWLAGLGSS
jgi:hypothetical protein